MNIERLRIRNLFCFRDVELDLRGAEEGKPVCIIEARNGQGKTSLLRCLILLFEGVGDGFKNTLPGGLSHKQVVFGNPTGGWPGILNRDAVARQQTEFWLEADVLDRGDRVTFRRAWEREPRGAAAYLGMSEVRRNGQTLKAEEAERLLGAFIAPGAIPYFIFDGELIRTLTVFAGGSLEDPIRSVLDLGPVERLRQRLEGIASRWEVDSASEEIRRRLAALEGALRNAEVEEQLAREAKARDEVHLRETRERLAEVEAELEGAIDPDGDSLERLLERRANLRAELNGCLATLYETDMPASPVLFNHSVAEGAMSSLREALAPISDRNRLYEEHVRGLLATLPVEVFDGPPLPAEHISPDVVSHYKARLVRSLNAKIPPPSTDRPKVTFAEVYRPVAERVLATLARWNNANLSGQAQERLSQLAARTQELGDLNAAIELSVERSKEDKAHVRALAQERNSLRMRLGALELVLGLDGTEGIHDPTILRCQATTARLRAEIRALKTDLARRGDLAKRAVVARRSARFWAGFERQMWASRREQLNIAFNRRFHELFSSSTLISRVELDRNYKLRPLDERGQPLPIMSASEGTRQTIATALIWALAEHSAWDFPVVIDTPLARLDKEHREAFLTRYLPHAARQVILLPTDSEVGADEMARIRRHVYRRYTIQNRSGVDARFEPVAP